MNFSTLRNQYSDEVRLAALVLPGPDVANNRLIGDLLASLASKYASWRLATLLAICNNHMKNQGKKDKSPFLAEIALGSALHRFEGVVYFAATFRVERW